MDRRTIGLSDRAPHSTRDVRRGVLRATAGATVLWAGWISNYRGELDAPTKIACVVVFLLWAARKLAYRETHGLPARYYDAFARGDADELAALSRLFRLFHPDDEERAAHEMSRLGEEMIVRKRWAEAQAALEKVDLAHFPAHARAVVLNNLAYVTARNGDTTRALEIVDRAYEDGERAS